MRAPPSTIERDIEMKLTTKLGAAGATLGVGTFGLVAALSGGPVSAQTPTASATPPVQVATPPGAPPADTGNAQVGSQTAPDAPAAGEAPEASESTAAPETAAATDGPGGHQDPAGNVDHQASGNE
jgi:hypothetical protein